MTDNPLPSNSRLSAVIALVHILDKSKPLDTAWADNRHFLALSPSDKAFTQLLVKTILRRKGQIDNLISQLLDHPLTNKTSRITHILRLGIAQLIWLETPAHAAVHSSVEITKQIKMAKFSGLINAVLKRVVKEGRKIIDQQDAAILNTPDWLWQSWEKTYGKEAARKIAETNMKEPPLDITVKSDPELWAEQLGGIVLKNCSVRLQSAKNITHLKGFSDGEWWVQDAAASIPARLFGDVNGKHIIDLCAAPGGKTAQLLSAGAKVLAVDRSKERISILKTNMHRLKLRADYVVADATELSPNFVPNAILLDAPCSATGTLRRHPDVAWHRKPEDIARLTETQYKLLNHALDILKPDSTLVYSVCSLQPEEGELQISRILSERSDVTLVAIDPEIVGGLKEYMTERGEVRTLPFYLSELGGMDGFFAATLVKK